MVTQWDRTCTISCLIQLQDLIVVAMFSVRNHFLTDGICECCYNMFALLFIYSQCSFPGCVYITKHMVCNIEHMLCITEHMLCVTENMFCIAEH